MTGASQELTQNDLLKKSNFNMLCRNDCRLLENVFCEKEFAIGKRHPIIGKLFLNFKSCSELLGEGEVESGSRAEEKNDTNEWFKEEPPVCLSIGINKMDSDGHRDEETTCYWGDGSEYTGSVNRTISGRRCEYWSKSPFKDIQQHSELIGNNFCR